MKKLLSALLCLVIVVLLLPTATPVQAFDNGTWEYTVSADNEATIQKYLKKGSATSVQVPETLGGYPVVAIGDLTFYGDAVMETVNIPDSIKSIGIRAFDSCTALKNINGAAGVQTIGGYAFYHCTGLEYPTIPDNATEIGAHAFEGCTSLRTLDMPVSVKTIGYMAFSGCTALNDWLYCGSLQEWQSVTVGSGNEPLLFSRIAYANGPVHFTGVCGADGGNVKWALEESYDSFYYRMVISGTGAMKDYADSNEVPWWEDMQYVSEIQINPGVTSIGAWALSNCSTNESICIPDTVTKLGEYAFCKCDNLPAVNIPSGVTEIPQGAFWLCSSLSSITIPEGVTSIGKDAFFYCENLKDVTIPGSVSTIGASAFSCCSIEELVIPYGVKTIKVMAFTFCDHLKSVTLPASVTKIEAAAFDDCDKLTDVYYGGTAAQWENLKKSIEECNDALTGAAIHYSSGAAITAQPENVTAAAGATATFKVTATGAETYQWQASTDGGATWANSGANGNTTATLSFTTLAAHSGYLFRCIVKGGGKTAVSNAAKLMVSGVSAAITGQPSNATAAVGATATFKVVATGAETYQWQASTDGGATWKNSGANGNTTATLSFTAAAAHNNYQFRCVVKGGGNTVISHAAKLTVSGSGPTITTQPSNATAAAGATAAFKVVATGAETYQWQASTDGGATWANSGANGNTTATLSFTAAAAHNGYQFRCIVKGGGKTVVSNAAKLTVTGAGPTITVQPVNVTAAVGAAVEFKVTATGAETYQWQASTDGGATWANSGANGNQTATLSFTAAAAHNGYQFRCVVKGGGKTVISNAAKLTVSGSGAAITAQPANVTAAVGAPAVFKVFATGAETYQWQASTDGGATWKNSGANGNTTATLSFTAAAAHNNYRFRCVVKGGGNTVISNAAKLTVSGSGAAITAQPANVTAAVGAPAAFKVVATGAESYQWQASTDGGATWANSGANGNQTATLSFTAAAAHSGYMFRCIVKGGGKTVVSNAAKLTVSGVSAAITIQPANVTAAVGAPAAFKVVATGAETYQWQVSTDGGATWVNSGANGNKTAILSFTAAAAHNNYQFRCIVKGGGNTVISNGAKLTVS